jgi:hypothetical protein
MAIQGLDMQAGTPDKFLVETMVVAPWIQGCCGDSLFFDRIKTISGTKTPRKIIKTRPINLFCEPFPRLRERPCFVSSFML